MILWVNLNFQETLRGRKIGRKIVSQIVVEKFIAIDCNKIWLLKN